MDKSKFVFQEIFNNSNGKTSGSGFCGVVIVLSGVLGFLGVLVGYFIGLPLTIELIPYLITYIGIGATLLGVRKLKKETENNAN